MVGEGIVKAGQGIIVHQGQTVEWYLDLLREKMPEISIGANINSWNFTRLRETSRISKDFFIFNPGKVVLDLAVLNAFHEVLAIPASMRDLLAYILLGTLPKGNFSIVATGQSWEDRIYSQFPQLVFHENQKILNLFFHQSEGYHKQGSIFLGCKIAR